MPPLMSLKLSLTPHGSSPRVWSLGLLALYCLGAVGCSSDTGSTAAGIGASTSTGGTTPVSPVGSGGTGGTGPVIGNVPPPGSAGSGTSTGGMPTGPTGFPAGYIPADLGGYLVGDPITNDAAMPTPTTESGCGTTILAVIRDFQGDGVNFENPAFNNKSTDDKGTVAATLGADQKPALAVPGQPTITITDPAGFDTWYRNVDGTNLPFIFNIYFEPNGTKSTFSSSAFFPLDGIGFGNDGNDDRRMMRNFHFTTEIHTAFQYAGGEIFTFTGDDDVFVYINNQLALDLGGIHGQESQTITVDTLGLTVGQVYPFDMFQAERHTTQSNFKAETTLAFVNCGTIVSGEPR